MTLGDAIFRKSLMKMIYRKFPKPASLPVTCHPVEWFQNWQDAETVMTGWRRHGLMKISNFLVRAVAQVPSDTASRFCVDAAEAISFRLIRARNLRFFRGW